MTVSDDLLRDAFSQQSDLPLVLLKIEHADLATDILVANNNENVTSGGDEYVGFPFDIVLPDSVEDAAPRAKLRIDNVSREIVEAIRTISSPPSVSIKVVRQDSLDVVEYEFVGMILRIADFNALSVSGDLEFEDLTRETYPAYTFNPANFQGIL